MSAILIRNVDDELKQALRVQAARNGRSMEEEARVLLRRGLKTAGAPDENLYDSIRRRVQTFGGVEIPSVSRELPAEPVELGR